MHQSASVRCIQLPTDLQGLLPDLQAGALARPRQLDSLVQVVDDFLWCWTLG